VSFVARLARPNQEECAYLNSMLISVMSLNGGSYPAWSGNGKEPLPKDLTDDLWVSRINAKGSEVVVGTPQHLFHASTPGNRSIV
jgi:hypothetical protein